MPKVYKMRLLDKATKPILLFRISRWPFQSTRAHQLDAVQRRMLAIPMGMRVADGQDPAVFRRLRAKEAAKMQAQVGKWSALWASKVVSWHEHLERPRNADTWTA